MDYKIGIIEKMLNSTEANELFENKAILVVTTPNRPGFMSNICFLFDTNFRQSDWNEFCNKPQLLISTSSTHPIKGTPTCCSNCSAETISESTKHANTAGCIIFLIASVHSRTY